MKKLALVVSTGILFLVAGCSKGSGKTASNSGPAVVQAAVAPASTSPVTESVAPLPALAAGQANPRAWRSETFNDGLGTAVALKGTSLDGKFDLVIVQKGSHSFLSFARHGRWESVHNQPGQGKLMYLRVKFEDGEEKRIEWDELGFATEKVHSVLWSYPIKAGPPTSATLEGTAADSVGGDQLLLQDMMKHKAMLLEVAPGVTTQFDTTGLARELERVRTSKTQAVLEARQTAE